MAKPLTLSPAAREAIARRWRYIRTRSKFLRDPRHRAAHPHERRELAIEADILSGIRPHMTLDELNHVARRAEFCGLARTRELVQRIVADAIEGSAGADSTAPSRISASGRAP